MSIHKIILYTPLLLLLILNACGGSGGGDNADTEEDITDNIETPPPTNPGNAENFFCASNISTTMTLISKSTYEYSAENTGCFGAQKDSASLKKKLTSIEVEFTTAPMLVISNTVRITHTKTIGGGTWFYYGFELTNTDNVAYCSIRLTGTRSVLDVTGNALLEFGGTRIGEPCIPAGETRSYYDSFIDIRNTFDVNTIDKMIVSINASATNITDSIDTPYLDSDNFEWQATPMGEGAALSYDLSATIGLVNNQGNDISTDDGPYNMVFLDNNNYPVYIGFANPVGGNPPSPGGNIPITASGGTQDITYSYNGVNARFPQVFGKATKLRIQLKK